MELLPHDTGGVCVDEENSAVSDACPKCRRAVTRDVAVEMWTKLEEESIIDNPASPKRLVGHIVSDFRATDDAFGHKRSGSSFSFCLACHMLKENRASYCKSGCIHSPYVLERSKHTSTAWDESAKKPTARSFEKMTQQAKTFIADTKYYKEAYAKANSPVEKRLGEKKKTKRRKPVLDSEGNKMEEPDAKYDNYKSIYQIPLVSTGKVTDVIGSMSLHAWLGIGNDSLDKFEDVVRAEDGRIKDWGNSTSRVQDFTAAIQAQHRATEAAASKAESVELRLQELEGGLWQFGEGQHWALRRLRNMKYVHTGDEARLVQQEHKALCTELKALEVVIRKMKAAVARDTVVLQKVHL